ncbi:MAG: Hsp70 family protein [Acidimicrobiales bacterium]
MVPSDLKGRPGPVLTLSLGATAVAAVAGGEADGRSETPTVAVVESGRLRVGRAAMALADADPGGAIADALSRLGQPGPVVIDGHPVDPVDLAAAILAEVAEGARLRQGRPNQVELVHPARWSELQIAAMFEAARRAGLPDVTAVPSPIAVARHCLSGRRARDEVLVGVIDVGASTSTSVVRLAGGTDRAGDEMLGVPLAQERVGGDRFDDVLSDVVSARCSAAIREGLQSGGEGWPEAAIALRRAVRGGREALSGTPQWSVAVPTPAGQVPVVLNHVDVVERLRPEVAAVVAQFRRTLATAGVSVRELNRLVLTGAASRTPGVHAGVAEALPDIELSWSEGPPTSNPPERPPSPSPPFRAPPFPPSPAVPSMPVPPTTAAPAQVHRGAGAPPPRWALIVILVSALLVIASAAAILVVTLD